MIRKRIKWGILLIAILTGSWVGFWLFALTDVSYKTESFWHNPPRGWSYTRGYCTGIRWAATDLRHGNAVKMVAGLIGFENRLDAQTGLNRWQLEDVIDQELEGYADGYNVTIEAFIRWRGYPSNSRKKWEDIFLNLKAYFDDRVKNELPVLVRVDGVPARVPGIENPVSVRKLVFSPGPGLQHTEYRLT